MQLFREERKNIAILMQKWPGAFSHNGRRKDPRAAAAVSFLRSLCFASGGICIHATFSYRRSGGALPRSWLERRTGSDMRDSTSRCGSLGRKRTPMPLVSFANNGSVGRDRLIGNTANPQTKKRCEGGIASDELRLALCD